MISIIKYEAKYAAVFRQLNLEWLDKYGLTEEADLAMLDNPEGEIINTGGCIFLAKDGEDIIGSAALIKEAEGIFELAKMAVSKSWQGKGISKLLIQRCLDTAKELGARKIFLVSNSQLQTAIHLYENYGFRHVPLVNAHYLSADIMMELML